ncbi:HIT family protein [Candidatus Woesearchaeota archaeon]|nr:HIT family protein [Candidatus Woesearchaeota archaeon]
METCIFCKIVKGEIPSSKVYEDNEFLAFLDIGPIHKGHTLLIPKEHHEDLFTMPDNLLELMSGILKKVGAAVMKGTKADGINVGMNNKPAAGQIVFHAHYHIIPRFKGDGLRHWPQGKYENPEEMQKYSDIIKQNL